MKKFTLPTTLVIALMLAACRTWPWPEIDLVETETTAASEAPLPEAEPVFRIISGRNLANLDEAVDATRDDGTARSYTSILDETKLETVYYSEMPLGEVAVALTEMIGRNVVASSQARDRKISVFLKDISARSALEGICRLHDLWYREDPEMIRILTAEEYGQQLVVRRDEQTRMYYLRNASAPAVADMLASLMPDQVEYIESREEESYGHVGTDGDDPLENRRAAGSARYPYSDRSSGGYYDDGGDVYSRRHGGRQVSRTAYRYSQSDLTGTFHQGFTEGRVDQIAQSLSQRQRGEVSAEQLADRSGVRAPVTISVFMRNNCVAVRAVQESIHREIEQIVKSLDTPTRQVLLEVKVLKVTLGDGFESFFSMNYRGSNRIPEVTTAGATYREPFPPGIATPPDATAAGVLYRDRAGLGWLQGAAVDGKTVSFTYLDHRLTATLEMLKKDNRVHAVATPMLLCANNAPAEFFSGVQRMITTNYDYETRYAENNRAVDVARPIVEEREIGTKVRIKPSINSDGTVTLRFLLEIGSVKEDGANVYQVKEGALVRLPIDTVDNEKLESIVVGRHGQAIVLGGLISESVTRINERVPFFGDIPYLGVLFGKQKDAKVKNETVILIIPHIVGHPEFGKAASDGLLENNSSHPWATRQQRNLTIWDDKKGEMHEIRKTATDTGTE